MGRPTAFSCSRVQSTWINNGSCLWDRLGGIASVYAHKWSLCSSGRTDYHSEHSTSGQKWSWIGGGERLTVQESGGRRGNIWQQPFSQSGLTHTEPCVARKPCESDTNSWLDSAHHQSLSAVDNKAAFRYKGVFSSGGACRRMRSRGDPAQLQPQSHTGTLQVTLNFFLQTSYAELHLSVRI